MDKWEDVKIEDLFKIKSGAFLPKKKQVDNGNYDVYGGNGITGNYDDFNLNGENIIIGRVGAKCGNVRWLNKKIWLTDNAFYISEYLRDINKYYLKTFLEYVDIGKTANQAAQPVISFKSIKEIEIPLPPIEQQQQIVAKLDALFERIDKSIALLEENIKHTKYLMASVLDEEFGKIDKSDWVELKTISDLITKGSSPNWQGVNYVDKPGVLFITSKNVGNHKLILGDKKTYLETKFNEIQPRSILQKNDILLNIVGASIGRTAKYDLDELANINQAVCLIRLKKDLVDIDYALHFFNSSTCISYMFDKKVDNARANLSMRNIQKFSIPLPKLEEQLRIKAKIGALLNKIELTLTNQTEKLNHLKALKSSLLDKAFKGELV